MLLARISARYPGMAKAVDEPNDTARSYRIPGHAGSFGFISSMSDHFCGSCNRLRVTADGQIKVCLFDAKEISLRNRMRAGASDDELLQVIGMAVKGKAEKHALMDDIDVVTNRPMILIGGCACIISWQRTTTLMRTSRICRSRDHSIQVAQNSASYHVWTSPLFSQCPLTVAALDTHARWSAIHTEFCHFSGCIV